MSINKNTSLPIAVIGAGPVGLAAAAHLARRGIDFVLFEKGPNVGSHVTDWGHVRMFSPWKYSIDPVARQLLEAQGWVPPDPEAYPTGSELVERLLAPLADLPEISSRLHLATEILSISRTGVDRLKSTDRDSRRYRLRLRTTDGHEEDLEVRAVIDASGTWGQPSPLGASGVPAIGETASDSRVHYGIPDLGHPRIRESFAAGSVAVVGSGDSAFNTLIELAAVAEEAPTTRVHWVLRGSSPSFRTGTGDRLPERAALAGSVERLVTDGQLLIHEDFRIVGVEGRAEDRVLKSDDGRSLTVDRVVAVTGFRPDLEMLRELRLSLDVVTEAPLALGPLIDPNVHSCGTVAPHGYEELIHPDEGFFMAGIKSYGRAPTFLLLTGYEQVRSIVAFLAGDLDAARQVSLVLLETGVCSTDFAPATVTAVASCCGAPSG